MPRFLTIHPTGPQSFKYTPRSEESLEMTNTCIIYIYFWTLTQATYIVDYNISDENYRYVDFINLR